MAAVQNYQTDILQEHVDSTALLIERLNKWKSAVSIVQSYIQGYLATQNGITSSLEKTRKHIQDVPQFEGQSVSGTHVSPDATTVSGGIADAFASMHTRTDSLITESDAVANGIKASILPALETLDKDIDTHYKNLKNHGGKGMKEVDSARQHTLKYVERLGRLTSSFGTQKLETKEDPFIIHRSVQAAIIDQVNKENSQAEASLNVQRNFATLEIHALEVLVASLRQLDQMLAGFAGNYRHTHAEIATAFASVDSRTEWLNFTTINKESLVPENNYRRAPENVTFTNMDHPATVPVLEGVLQRKGTVLKSWQNGYFVVTKCGFLHQFKSQDAHQDTMPELSLYLPDSALGAMPSRASGELKFTISSKNANKVITQKHKFVFKAASYDELENWYSAISGSSSEASTGSAHSGPELPSRTNTTSSVATPTSPTMDDVAPSPIGSPSAHAPAS